VVIDEGIALYFPAPQSFTGEDCLELQAHGSPVVLDLLLARVFELGARPARAGEFSERAFLEGRMDLAQAEAVADLIDSTTSAQARLAARTLRGALSARVQELLDALTRLRAFVEAALDFPDDEIDLLGTEDTDRALSALIEQTEGLLQDAERGERVRDGLFIVIAGPPNVGKSSLLNALSGDEVAIVTPIPGTTRDLLRAEIQLDGLPIHCIDTAGLRGSDDPVEQEGIRRARTQIEQADRVLWLVDDALDPEARTVDRAALTPGVALTVVRNKIDISGRAVGMTETSSGDTEISCSALTGAGLSLLREHLKGCAGYCSAESAGLFSARRRHLDALRRTQGHLTDARNALHDTASCELMAEDLRHAQRSLAEITGELTSEDLLGKIFGEFCIGK
jgi:tRNA modification GTPase